MTLLRPSGESRMISGCLPDDTLDSVRGHASRREQVLIFAEQFLLRMVCSLLITYYSTIFLIYLSHLILGLIILILIDYFSGNIATHDGQYRGTV